MKLIVKQILFFLLLTLWKLPVFSQAEIQNTASSSTDWKITGNSGTNPSTNFVGTTDAQSLVLRTNSVERVRILTSGYVGIGTAAPTSLLHATADAAGLPIIQGINTNTAATGTAAYGVLGESNCDVLGSAGVSGASVNSSDHEIGVIGDYVLWGTGVFGMGWGGTLANMTTLRDYGVFGTVSYSTGTGVYGYNGSTSSTAYGVYSQGNFAVTGTKAASVPTSQGNQLLYCVESPEIWFEEIGHAQLQNGRTTIKLDPMFLETVVIDNAHPMEVFIQEQDETNGLIVRSGNTTFEVIEKSNGSSNSKFSFRVLAKRKNYQDHRFGVDANQPLEDNRSKQVYHQAPITDLGKMKEFIARVTLEKSQLEKK